MRTAGSILGIVLAAALGACAHHAQTAGAQAPSGTAQAQGGANAATCPLAQLRNVHASVADINNGVAITFTGPQDEVDQLRKNVQSMADANDTQGDAFAACPCALSQGIGAAQAQGATSMQAPAAVPADAHVSDIDTGAVLKLTAKNKGQLSQLRSEVRNNVQTLKSACLSQPGGSSGGYDQGYQQNR